MLVPVTTQLFEVSKDSKLSTWQQLFGSKDGDRWKRLCLPDENPALAEVLVPVLTAMGSAAWDLGVAAVNRKVDEFQERSIKSWGASWSGRTAAWDNLNCLVLARVNGHTDPSTQMSILLVKRQFQTHDQETAAFQFAPALVASRTSRALTKDEGQGKGRIGLSVAAAATGFKSGTAQENVADAVSIGGIAVSAPTTNGPLNYKLVADDHFNFTKPLKYPAGSDVYINFSVVETGALAGLDSQSKAEIKAMTDALGPVAKEAWKKKLEKEGKKEE
ncbi:hypothetical protein [Pseudomonas asplenii]|uniref:hypothetical protein n=1 Tax=Pseudomonas asplenii TaxID=53407 RepID=UPI0003752AA2|nr:hypothetical protein [Pseudomonas fuscovaginae]